MKLAVVLISIAGEHMVPVLNSIGTDVACVGVRMALLGTGGMC